MTFQHIGALRQTQPLLTPTQLDAVETLADGPAFRVRGHWRWKGGALLRTPVAEALLAAGVARRSDHGIAPALVLTEAGRALVERRRGFRKDAGRAVTAVAP